MTKQFAPSIPRSPILIIITIFAIIIAVILMTFYARQLRVEREMKRELRILSSIYYAMTIMDNISIVLEFDREDMSIFPSEEQVSLGGFLDRHKNFLESQSVKIKEIEYGKVLAIEIQSNTELEIIYRSGDNWFVLVTPGIDGRHDFFGGEKQYDDARASLSLPLLSAHLKLSSYDPTNGMQSGGDLIVTSENLPFPPDRSRGQYFSIASDSPSRTFPKNRSP